MKALLIPPQPAHKEPAVFEGIPITISRDGVVLDITNKPCLQSAILYARALTEEFPEVEASVKDPWRGAFMLYEKGHYIGSVLDGSAS